MRNIGQLASEGAARKLGDFLYLKGIRNEVEEEGGAWALWIFEEDQVDDARKFLDEFRANPDGKSFVVDSRRADAERKAEAREGEDAARRQWTRERIFARQGAVQLGMVSLVLILICGAVFLATDMGKNSAVVKPLQISEQPFSGRVFALSSALPEVTRGQVWRLVTPMLLHFGFWHLLFNMLWLKDLGSLIETRLGAWYLVWLVLGVAVTSNVAQYWWSGPGFGGMSGVVYGLFGFVWVRGRFDPASGLEMDQATVIMMMIWFVVCVFGLVGPVANVVHGVGLAGGALWGFISAQMRGGK